MAAQPVLAALSCLRTDVRRSRLEAKAGADCMWVLLVFVMLWAWEGSQWLLPTLQLAPVPFGVISAAASAVVAVGVVLTGRHDLDKVGRRQLHVGAFGAGALALPALLLVTAQRFFAAEVAMAALAGVPVVVMVVQTATSAEDGSTAEALLPALMGLTGAMLMIPVRLPASETGWIGLGLDLAAVLSAGIFGVLGHQEARSLPLRSAVVSVAVGNTIAFAGGAALLFWSDSARLRTASVPGVLVLAGDLAMMTFTVLATILLLYVMAPLRFAARFLLIPPLGAAEAYLLLRPSVSFRAGVGAALMLVVGAWLLRGASAESARESASFLPPRSSK